MAYLNNEGLRHVWDKVAEGLKGKANKVHKHDIAEVKGLTVATSSSDGLMAAADKNKLDGIPADPARAFYITVTQTGADSYSVDKTGQEIVDAYDAGCVLIAYYGDDYHYCKSKYTETQGNGVDVVINSSTIRFFASNAEYNSVITIYIQLGKYGPNNINNISIEYYKSTMLVDHLGNSSNPHNVTLSQLGVNASADELNYIDGVTSNIQTQLNNKAGKSAATTSVAGLMSSTDKSKLDGIATGANNYTHPTYTARTGKPTANATPAFGGTFTVSQITSDGTGHVTGATDRTITIPSIAASQSAAGLMSAADKTKLDGIASGATKYSHPTYTSKTSGLYKITVDGTGHVSSATAVAKSDITALGIPSSDTTYSAATTSVAGLMSAADKTKLDGIAAGATKITVDSALSSSSTNPVQNKAVNAALEGKADKSQAIFYIQGGGTTDTTNKKATWTGSHSDITEYYDGLMIAYKVGTAASTTTTLNINNLGAVKVVRNVTTAVSTAYGVDAIVLLTYTTDSSGTSYWKVADYDSDTKTRSSNKADTKMYIIGASSQSTSGQTTYSNSKCYIGADNRLYSAGVVVPNISEIEALIDEKLGVIENASY